MRENDGGTPSPGRPAAAPVTAGTLLSAERGARMEMAVGRRRSMRAPAAAAAEGKIERLHERGAAAANRLQVTRRIETGLETAREDNLSCCR